MAEIACAECERPFVPHLKRNRFCSKGCRQRAYDRHPDDTKDTTKNALCGVCRAPFVKQRRSQGYCSRDCQTKAWALKNPEKNRARVRQHKIDHPEWYAERTPIYSRNHRARVLSTRPWRYMLRSRQSEAERKKLPFDLTDAWAAARWTGCCEITGITFQPNPPGGKSGPMPFSPSLDKIDAALGYVQTNCRFILWGCNAVKGAGTDFDMLEIAKAIVKAARKNL